MNESTLQKKWTVMVYLAGDNNLSEDMVTALKGMLTLNSNDKVNLFTCYDSVHPLVKTSIYDFTRRVTSGQERTLETVRGPEIGSDVYGDELITTKILKEFFDKCFAGGKAEAENYILILSGHGDGFRERSFLYDENPSGSIALNKLDKTLKEIQEKHLGDKKFAILGFDSCFMAMYEVAYQFQNLAHILVNSQSNVPNSGWVYEKMLKSLFENASESTEYHAAEMVKEYKSANYEYNVSGRSTDLSAIRLNQELLESLNEAIHRLAERLGQRLHDKYPAIQCGKENQEKKTDAERAEGENTAVAAPRTDLVAEQILKLILDAHWNAQTFLEDQAVDLQDFCYCLQEKCQYLLQEIQRISGEETQLTAYAAELTEELHQIIEACQKVVEAVDKCVISSCYSGPDFQYARGVSLYFPWSFLGYCISMRAYKTLRFFKSGGGKYWENFLNKYLKNTMRESRDKFKIDYTPPISKGDLSLYQSYFDRVKNVPVLGNIMPPEIKSADE